MCWRVFIGSEKSVWMLQRLSNLFTQFFIQYVYLNCNIVFQSWLIKTCLVNSVNAAYELVLAILFGLFIVSLHYIILLFGD